MPRPTASLRATLARLRASLWDVCVLATGVSLLTPILPAPSPCAALVAEMARRA